MFAVVINGAPGAGKTLCLEVLSDALDTETLSPDECAARIRAARPDVLGG